ncbi:hypothetical protein [Haloarchaeobius sp. DFWS5]|uniref:hypothetical protein n=1 Tax=Haloarchaeobius sp. DFWS5 TaxID=3446114 RepID=UPI003EC116AB
MRLFQFNETEGLPRSTTCEYLPVKSEANGEGEAELETWLNASPDALLDESVLLFARQPNLSTGIPDLLGLDRFGNVIVFELKRGDSGSESASEASIVSQPQLYAQALDRYDYHELDNLYTEYREKDWILQPAVEENQSLISTFNQFFDQDISSWELNRTQRLVIVAEEITAQTRQSARWLRDQGLDIQCVEVQRFRFPSGESGFGAVTIVDYDESRTRTESNSKPGDRVFTTNVFTKSFSEVKDTLCVDKIDPILGNLSTNYPYLETHAAGHPESVRYALRVNPFDECEVKVAIDAAGTESVHAEKLRDHRDIFECKGFTVSSRKSMRIVVDTWEIDGVEDLRDDAFIDRVAKRYIELLKLGHKVFQQN